MRVSTATGLVAASRIVFGAGLAVAPGALARRLADDEQRAAALAPLVRGFGARDAVLGAGTVSALAADRDVVRWIVAGVATDASDLASIVLAREHLPRPVVIGLATLAATTALTGLVLSVATLGRHA